MFCIIANGGIATAVFPECESSQYHLQTEPEVVAFLRHSAWQRHYFLSTVLTICHRIQLHENIGQAHRKHAFQIMANELRIPHTTVSSFYMALQLLISAVLIWLPVNHYLYLGLVVVALGAAYLIFMKKYYHLHEEYLRQSRKS